MESVLGFPSDEWFPVCFQMPILWKRNERSAGYLGHPQDHAMQKLPRPPEGHVKEEGTGAGCTCVGPIE